MAESELTPHDDSEQPNRAVFEVDRDVPRSIAVVNALAEVMECDPRKLPEPLYEAVDPGALDALLMDDSTSGATSVSVWFEYCDYNVGVTPERIIITASEPPL
ncbi:HalOD1 output domain-containing protein [Halomarina salina]|uniref:HalOD1 output domain-containing protein n=1 Tax=Halomarina salina TaxID=1872699 RepID=A0ABD5RQ25_9EURY|nr:HalOD1 output domain-containing protein [Halomarina salina]